MRPRAAPAILTLLLLPISAVFGDSSTVTVTVEIPDPELINVDGKVLPVLDGWGYPSSGELALPERRVMVAVPPGCEVVQVSVQYSDWRVIAEGVEVARVPEPRLASSPDEG